MSLLNDLLGTLDRGSVSEIATALGESNHSVVSGGLHSAIAALLGGLAGKSDNPGALRQALELAPPAGSATWSNVASAAAEPNSPAAYTGKHIVSTLFGSSEGAVTLALGEAGLGSGKMSSLMAAAAPMVMSFLSGRVRGEGLSMPQFGNLLQREMPAIRSTLPAGVTDLLWRREPAAVAAGQAASRAAAGTRSSLRWLLPLLAIALIPAIIWLVRQGREPVIQTPSTPAGTANRAIPETAIPQPSLTSNLDVYFETGSTTLRPESEARLKDFVSALNANPDAHVLVNGYTDNVGSAAGNMRLSQNRADAVKADLAGMGVSRDRVSAQGFGEQNPAADNTTPQGRDANRRVSVSLGER